MRKEDSMMRFSLITLICLALAGWVQAAPPDANEVVPLLKRGGYVVFIRHPKTNQDQADTDPLHIENVAAQRQLTDEGRAQARAIGEAFRKLGIPVERVVSSQFNRAQEASKLLNVGDVTTSVDVTEGGLVVPPKENKRRAEALKQLLGSAPAAGKNLVIVSHRPNLEDAAGKDLGDATEAEAVIFEPLGNGTFKVVARVAPDLWSQWAGALPAVGAK